MTKQQHSRKFLVLCVFTANILGFTVGLMLTWSSPVLELLESDSKDNPFDEPISGDESSWVGSLLSLGAVIGPFLAAISSEKLGRKLTLILLSTPLIFAFFMLAFGKVVALYYVARAVAGLAVGGVFTVLPTYIAEVSEDDVRGAMGASMNNFIVTGILLSYCIGPYLPVMWFSLICAIFGCVFAALFTIFMPETPQYLLSKGKNDEAKTSLMKLRSSSNVDDELASMNQYIQANSGGSFKDIFKSKGNIKALIISISLAAFQQLSGINIILFYAQTVFEATGSSIPSEISSMILGAVQFLASFVTPIAVDKLGRKILLLVSALGMFIAEVPLGVYFYLLDDGTNVDSIFWLPILCLVIYMTAYSFGFGPLPWTIMAELFPSNIKAIASSLTASLCWLVSFVLTKYFTALSVEIGFAGSFWIFSGFNVIAIIFILLYVPETKGKSTEEIQIIMSK